MSQQVAGKLRGHRRRTRVFFTVSQVKVNELYPRTQLTGLCIKAAATSLVHVCITGKEGVLSERPIHVINQ